jgi:hypothetical protein
MSETTTKRWQGFLIAADGQVEELAEDGEVERYWTSTSLYGDLLLAGYPLHADPERGRWDGMIDLSVDPDDLTDVTVYTAGQSPHEHSMGAASETFLRWYAENAL